MRSFKKCMRWEFVNYFILLFKIMEIMYDLANFTISEKKFNSCWPVFEHKEHSKHMLNITFYFQNFPFLNNDIIKLEKKNTLDFLWGASKNLKHRVCEIFYRTFQNEIMYDLANFMISEIKFYPCWPVVEHREDCKHTINITCYFKYFHFLNKNIRKLEKWNFRIFVRIIKQFKTLSLGNSL